MFLISESVSVCSNPIVYLTLGKGLSLLGRYRGLVNCPILSRASHWD